ncbi:tRNA lysidine(34) synthetase TilS [Rubricoccus marinus]|uniref:tRNA(Ile)-lysidine synthase n=1 Tax=Rubricoccus marinus TaxID=716817 RepID=A0A259U103_9BACT|nr:tRNA lysidine(34) synthetase TilS [Rubricoccus marinus]OZC03616.1 tRNA lysidine(34) synthetase TilS [Rubricoccus marinus]
MFRARFQSELDRLRASDGPVVVGVSGGVDSTVLWRSLHEAGVPTVAAHVDYGLREASGEDAAFVRALGAELGVPVHVREVTLGPGNRQALARGARYRFFREVAEGSGAQTVAVGHTADDQAETVLMNLIRGAGLSGLAGMADEGPLATAPEAGAAQKWSRGIRLVRPLLGFARREVEAEARARGWAWREDASNATDAYRRNRIRHHVLPLLEEEGGPKTVLRIAASAQAARRASGDAADRLARVGESRPDGGRVPLAALRALDGPDRLALLAEMMRAYAPQASIGRAMLEAIEKLLDAQAGTRAGVAPGTEVWRDRESLTVTRAQSAWLGASVRVGEAVETPYGTLALTPLAEVADAYDPDPNREVVDARAFAPEAPASRIAYPSTPLTLRLWCEGDRIRPLGMRGTKLVSDVLTDARVPSSERRQRLVLTSGETVLWVVGLRLAHEARLTPETEEAVEMTWAPNEHAPTA